MKKKKTIFLLLLLLLVVVVLFCFSLQNEATTHGINNKTPSLHHRLLNWIFPPNLDFRGTLNNNEPVATTINANIDVAAEEGAAAAAEEGTAAAAGEKVKEAVTLSLGTGKATVEESAKSAAKMLKQTFSHEL